MPIGGVWHMPAPCGQDGRSFHGSCRPPGRPVLTLQGFSVRTTSRGDRLARRALSSGAITSRVGSYTVGTRAGPATPGFLECCSLHGPHWWVAWQAGRWQPPPPLTHWHLAGVWVADPAGDQRPGSVSSGQLVSGGTECKVWMCHPSPRRADTGPPSAAFWHSQRDRLSQGPCGLA